MDFNGGKTRSVSPRLLVLTTKGSYLLVAVSTRRKRFIKFEVDSHCQDDWILIPTPRLKNMITINKSAMQECI
jgi:hypothetical protein